jgi:peptide/nickel transport system ATP-binding protein
MSALLETEDLTVEFREGGLGALINPAKARVTHAVNGVTLSIAPGETVGLVGESGCGKSTLGRAMLRLVEPRAGKVSFDGTELTGLDPARLLGFRRRAQMIFQDPFAALNPRFTIGETLAEVFRVHRLCKPSEIPARVAALMQSVGLSPDLASRRPAALSGGQCQRVGIARALAVGPELLIADEAVSALDVSIQAQILNLLTQLCAERHLALIFISHDLGVIRHLCRRVAVMYLGRIVEEGPTEAVFSNPRHPYTEALLASIPRMAPDGSLPPPRLTGEPPSPTRLPVGCAFNPRCAKAFDACRAGLSPAQRSQGTVRVACHLYEDDKTPAGSPIRSAGH